MPHGLAPEFLGSYDLCLLSHCLCSSLPFFLSLSLTKPSYLFYQSLCTCRPFPQLSPGSFFLIVRPCHLLGETSPAHPV
jgi:hypothetical protein